MLSIIGAATLGYVVASAVYFALLRKNTGGTYRIDEDLKTSFLWPFALAIFALMIVFYPKFEEA